MAMDDRRENLPLQPLTPDEITALIAEARAAALAEIRRRLAAAFTETLWEQICTGTDDPAGRLVPAPDAPAGRLVPAPDAPAEHHPPTAQPAAQPPDTPTANEELDEAALRIELETLRNQLAANRARRTATPAAQITAVPDDPPIPAAPPAADVPEPDLLPADDWGYYVYGIMRSGVRPTGPGIIPGTRLETLPCGDLSAVVSAVPLNELDEAVLAERAHDIAWIESIVRAHQAAQEALLPLGPLVPMRLATIFTSTANVAAMVRERAADLRAALDRIDGHGEWGVQLFADEAALADHAAAVSPVAADLRRRLQRGGSGAAYMLQRRIERAAAEEADRIAAACAARVHERLSNAAAAAVAGPLREREPGAPDLMLLNGAYLVADAALPAFIDTVEALAVELAPLGIRVVRTGPWPAYHFV